MKAKGTSEADKWNNYWTNKKSGPYLIYGKLAEFYRKTIIKPALNYFIKSNFKKQSKLLHAGCGTGQVDIDLTNSFKITGVDISEQALRIYKRTNPNSSRLIKADVKRIPARSASFDGIYNLGLMEHFTQQEINKILKEFRRVLKPDGKIIFFWPPVFGISVISLKLIHKIINLFSNNKIVLHPDEISLVKSQKQIEMILKENGFKLTKFYFGPRDMFTHCIIVAKKDKARR